MPVSTGLPHLLQSASVSSTSTTGTFSDDSVSSLISSSTSGEPQPKRCKHCDGKYDKDPLNKAENMTKILENYRKAVPSHHLIN